MLTPSTNEPVQGLLSQTLPLIRRAGPGTDRSAGCGMRTSLLWHRRVLRVRGWVFSIGLVPLLAATLFADGGTNLPDFSNLSLEELSAIKVTSVSKKEQKLSQVAAAVYVISQEEIHRSGMTNVADLLRLVPGITVARLDSSQ